MWNLKHIDASKGFKVIYNIWSLRVNNDAVGLFVHVPRELAAPPAYSLTLILNQVNSLPYCWCEIAACTFKSCSAGWTGTRHVCIHSQAKGVHGYLNCASEGPRGERGGGWRRKQTNAEDITGWNRFILCLSQGPTVNKTLLALECRSKREKKCLQFEEVKGSRTDKY